MKNKKIIFSVLVAGILVLNTFFLSTVKDNDLKLNSLFTLASAQAENGENGEEINTVTITCDPPRYGQCNRLFSYDPVNEPFGLSTAPVWYFCAFTGYQWDKCTFWEETIIQGLSCFFFMMQWM